MIAAMRAIGYFRAHNGQPASAESGEKAFSEYCARNSHQAVTHFSDLRPAGQGDAEHYRRMIDHMRESGSEFLVVVPDASHLGSELESVARAMVELEGMGAKVVCMDEDFPDPLQNAFQSLGIKGVSRIRSNRIKASMRERAMQGRALGKPLFGYRIGGDGTLEIVRKEAAVVELIFRLFTKEGLGLRLIAQQLNERGISTRRGGRWNVVTIRDILRNSVYMGTYSRFGLRLPSVHEAIISPQVFRAAQDQTRERRPVGRVSDPHPFELSGLVYCGHCGNKMIGSTRRQSWKRKDGTRARGVYRYYQCQSRANQSMCAYHTWRASRLEANVLSQLRQALRSRALGAGRDDGSEAERLRRVRAIRDARVKNGERKFVQAMRRAARGAIVVKVLGDYLHELDAARRALEATGSPVDLMATVDNWESLDIDERRLFVEEHVVRIEVMDESVDLAM